MNCSLSCSKLKIVPARNLPNQAWAGLVKVRGNALQGRHINLGYTHPCFIGLDAGNRICLPIVLRIADILKFLGGIIEEMLVGKGDCVSKKTSRTGSRALCSASSRSICACICDRRFSSGVTQTGPYSQPTAQALPYGRSAERAGQSSPWG